jgi:hypothetical protein
MQVLTTKFHEKPSSESRIVPRQTERQMDGRREIPKLKVTFQNI